MKYKLKGDKKTHINNGGYPAATSSYSMIFVAVILGIPKIIYVVNNMAEGYKNPMRWLDYPIDMFIKKKVTVFITGSDYAGKKLKKVAESACEHFSNVLTPDTNSLHKNHFHFDNGFGNRCGAKSQFKLR